MALSGSFSKYPVTASYGNFGLYCEWTGTQNISNNSTSITLKVYLRYWELYVSARSDSTVSINGVSETYTAPAISHDANSDYYRLLKTYTVNVPHNSDGTKSCTLSASWRMSGTYSGVSVGTITASTTVTLDTIPRASSITSAANTEIGSAVSVKWTPASSSFKYKLKFTLGSYDSGWTGYVSPAQTSAYTYTGFTIPSSVANQLTSATSGTMTVYLATYNSGGTQIGSTASKTFTVTVPSGSKPTIGSVTTSIVNTNTTISGWGVAVKGYSKVRVKATASGASGSTISSFTITGGYSTTQTGSSLDYTGGVISSSGSISFSVTAKDSRGRVSSASSSSVAFYEYTKPQVTSFVAQRGSTSTSMDIKANWSFSSIGGYNSATAKLYYKKSTSSSWTQYGTISRNTLVSITGFDEASSYNFKVTVTDSLSSSASEETFVSTIGVLLDFRAGGRGLGVGKIAESNAMEVALDSVFIGNVYIKVGASNISLKTT